MRFSIQSALKGGIILARPKTLKEVEKKSARISLLMTPQLLADVTTLAQIKQCSLNDLLTSLAAQVVKKNRQQIDEVQGVMNEAARYVQLSIDFETAQAVMPDDVHA